MEDLVEQYEDIMQASNWIQTPEALRIANEYYTQARLRNKVCMECNTIARIDCEFH